MKESRNREKERKIQRKGSKFVHFQLKVYIFRKKLSMKKGRQNFF